MEPAVVAWQLVLRAPAGLAAVPASELGAGEALSCFG